MSNEPEGEVVDDNPDAESILAVAAEQLKAASLKSKVRVYSSVCVVAPCRVGIHASFGELNLFHPKTQDSEVEELLVEDMQTSPTPTTAGGEGGIRDPPPVAESGGQTPAPPLSPASTSEPAEKLLVELSQDQTVTSTSLVKAILDVPKPSSAEGSEKPVSPAPMRHPCLDSDDNRPNSEEIHSDVSGEFRIFNSSRLTEINNQCQSVEFRGRPM